MSTKTANSICRVFGILTLANFVTFTAAAIYLGGDAISGHEAGGHFFLSMKGQLTEVSKATFLYSRWHAMSLFAIFPLEMSCSYLVNRKNKSAHA